MFSWLLPGLLKYRRGLFSTIGAILSIALILLLILQHYFGSIVRVYPHLQSTVSGLFYFYALLGMVVCALGIYDRKRSAICGMLGVLAILTAMQWGIIAFGIFLALGLVFRYSEMTGATDLRDASPIGANNRTRRSRSIPRKLIREGRFHLLPLFYLLNLSGLGREGIARSGSYEFADHIYRSEPSGITLLGRWIDSILLKMPASVALRQRYKQSQLAIRRALSSVDRTVSPLRVLAIPCGLPRDLTELAATLKVEDCDLLSRIEYVGMDVDPILLEKARCFTANCGVPTHFHQGNALLRDSFPVGTFHAVVSTGLGEFLDDAQLAVFYGNVFDVLSPGGTFYTSVSHNDPRSERLLNAFELTAHYRTDSLVEATLRRSSWERLTITMDETGLQSFFFAVK